MKLSLRLCLPLLVIAPLAAIAQSKKPDAPSTQQATGSGRVDITNAPDGTATYDDAQGVARLTKNVVITQRGENLIVYAQQAVYSNKLNQATASGDLRVVTRDSTIRGLGLRADFDDRRFTISGSVKITSHGKNDGAMGGLRADANKKPITVLCDQVVWEYDTRQAVATGNIRISQGNSKGTCNKIIYDEARNTVVLQGNVQFGDDKNRTFLGQEIRVFLDENIVSADSKVIVRFNEKDGVGGDKSANKNPRPAKTPMPMPVVPKLPADVLKDFNAPGAPAATPAPTATEEPFPTPAPDEPAEDKETPTR